MITLPRSLLLLSALLGPRLVASEAEPPPENEPEVAADDAGSLLGDVDGFFNRLDETLVSLERAVPRWRIGGSVTALGRAEVEDGSQEVGQSEFEAHALHLFHLEQAWGLAGALSVTSRSFDADDGLALPESLVSVGTTAVGWHRVGERLHLAWLAHLGLRGEPDVLGDGLRAAAGVGAVWRPGGGWTVVGGLGVATALDRLLPIPVIAAIWRGERWTVALVPIAPAVGYRIDEHWSLGLGIKPSAGDYQLDEDDDDGEVLVYRDLRLYTYATYRASGRWQIGAEIGLAAARRIEWHGDGETRDDLDLDPAGYLGVSGGWHW